MRLRILIAAGVFCGSAVVTVTANRAAAPGAQPMLSQDLYLPAVTRDGRLRPPILDLVGQVGGAMEDVAVDGTLAFAGAGSRLVALDIADPANVRKVGQSSILTGAVDGVAASGRMVYVLAGGRLHVLDAMDPAHMRVTTTSTHLGSAEELVLGDGYAYLVTAGDTEGTESGETITRFVVVDVDDPTGPRVVGSLELPLLAPDVALAGSHAYVVTRASRTDRDSTVHAIDVRQPSAPQEVGALHMRAVVQDLAAGPEALYAGTSDGLHSVDISDASRPRLASTNPLLATGIVRVRGDILFTLDALSVYHFFSLADPLRPDAIGPLSFLMVNFQDAALGDGVLCIATETGMLVLDITDPAHPEEPTEYKTPLAYPWHVGVEDGYAYMTVSRRDQQRLWIVDAREPAAAEVVSSVEVGQRAWTLDVHADHAYVGTDSGLVILDVTDPAVPSVVGYAATEFFPEHVHVRDQIAYVTDWWQLIMVDLSDAAAPQAVGHYALDAAVSVTVDDDVAYVGSAYREDAQHAFHPGSVHVVDISDPARAKQLAKLDLPGYAADMSVTGARGEVEFATLWLAEAAAGGESDLDLTGLRAVDVSRPTAPHDVGFVEAPGFSTDANFPRPRMARADGRMFVTDHYVRNDDVRGAVWIVDVENPRDPVTLDWIPTHGWAFDVAVEGEFVYVADFDAGLLVYRIVR